MKKSLFLPIIFSFCLFASCETERIEIEDINSNLSTETTLKKSATSSTYYLNASNLDQTETFQNLINSMKANDILVLKAGNHYLSGTVHINKPNLIIVGEKNSFIRKTENLSCIDIDSNNTQIDNIYIDGGNKPEPCMRVYSNSNKIMNSTFRNSRNSGLLLHNSHLNVIEGCKFFYNNMVGLSQWQSSDNEIKYCQIYENGAEGITVDGHSHNSKIHHNWIHKNNIPIRGVGGIGIDASNGTQIYNNTIDYNGVAGIKFQNNLCGGCDGAKIFNNENISYNAGPAISKRYNNQPISNLGIYNNVAIGNSGGYIANDWSTKSCISF